MERGLSLKGNKGNDSEPYLGSQDANACVRGDKVKGDCMKPIRAVKMEQCKAAGILNNG